MARFNTAIKIINQVAVEVGLDAEADPYSSEDKNMIKLQYLLNTAGTELVMLYPWAILRKEATITTDGSESYALPSDFSYKIDQTDWNRTADLPMAGPLSAQDWSFILGRGLSADTFYASFRLMENEVYILPTSVASGTDIRYEYLSRNWVSTNSTTIAPALDEISVGTNAPLFEPLIIQRYLKVKWYESIGADSTKAQADFDQAFMFWAGKDKGGKILSLARRGNNYPYLDAYRNTPDTNFGV